MLRKKLQHFKIFFSQYYLPPNGILVFDNVKFGIYDRYDNPLQSSA